MTILNSRPILIAGIGSIGRRHLRNLRACGWDNFILYRTGRSTLPDLDDEIKDIPTFYDLDAALEQKPLAAVIANPTAAHVPTALALAKAGVHLFIEKPVSDTLDSVSELQQVVNANQLIVLVGFQFRFHPTLAKIKTMIDDGVLGSIASVSAHWGEYLPAWHPWEDYKQSYAARADLGGGVALTLCHPFDYLRWMVGEVVSVKANVGFNGGLGIEVEDTADAVLMFENGALGHVHLDYIQRPAGHAVRVTGERGTILWDNANGVASYWHPEGPIENRGWETFAPPENFERNTMFMALTEHFLKCLNGDESPRCTLHDGIRALEIALSVKNASTV